MERQLFNFGRIRTLSLFNVLTLSVLACGGEDPVTPQPMPVLTMTVAPDNTAILIGGTVQMGASITDQNNTVVTGQTIGWSTSNATVATVDATTGLVTGVAAGTATITGSSGTISDTTTIAVVASAAFSADVAPIFATGCALSGCHIGPTPPQDLDLDAGVAYANIVNVASQQSSLDRIEPGDPLASYLVHKIRGTQADVGGSGLQMPRNMTPLTTTLINIIVAWVRDGAPNN